MTKKNEREMRPEDFWEEWVNELSNSSPLNINEGLSESFLNSKGFKDFKSVSLRPS